jgi:hypothetical protein
MFTYILIVAVLLFYYRGKTAYWYIIWPGTISHELMHWIVGKVLFAKPSNIVIWPEKHVEGQPRTLGSVTFYGIDWFNALPTAIAPLLNIPVVLLLAHYVPHNFTLQSGLWIWVLASMLTEAMPSAPDWVIVTKRPWGLVFWITIIVACAYNARAIAKVLF